MTQCVAPPTRDDDEIILAALAVVTRGGGLAEIASETQRDAIDLAADVHVVLWADALAHGEVAA